MISSPSASLGVMMRSEASWSMRSLASTSLPSTAPATVALARPAPMDWATSMTVTGFSNSRRLPSGSVIVIIYEYRKRKKALRAFDTPTEEAGKKSAGEVGSAHVAR